jgi:endonuclease-3
MVKKERFKAFVEHFSTRFPEAETELHYSNPFELLVAVV